MSVIINVDKKVEDIISMLSEGYTEDDFLKKFREVYPKDYDKCMKRFLDEERHTKPDKTHLMRDPDHHIKCALRSYLSRKLSTKQ
ncbi:MAG: hypothetical protein K2L14_07505 [Duncaniella sp.]|nr:hypothetical protein [Duncaniella sp.]